MLALALASLLQLPPDNDPATLLSEPPVRLDATLDLWRPWLHGGTRESVYGPDPLRGRNFDLHDELDLEDGDTVPILRLSLTRNRGTLSLEYWRHTWRGSATLDGDSRFGGDVHPAGALVETRFRLERIAFDASVPIEGTSGPGRTRVGLRSIRTRVEMDGPDDEHISTWRDLQAVWGFTVESRPESRWAGRLSMAVGTDLLASWSAEIDAAAGLRAGAGLVEIGFRSFNYRAQILSDSIDFSVTGPYLGIALCF